MSLRFEDWSNNLLKKTMQQKYAENNRPFPESGTPFLLKVFLQNPTEGTVQELRDFMQEHQIPESFLDVSRVGRQGNGDHSRLHIDLYGDVLFDQDGKLIWTEEKIRSEGHAWKNAEQVWPGGEGNNTLLK